MISRWAIFVCAGTIFSALLAGGCCCQDTCGGCGAGGCGAGGGPRGGRLFCRPYEQRMADSNTYECGTCCKTVGCGGGIKGWLHNQATGCKGCSDVYWGEWISDPPDCCDPCDKCGGFTGSGGNCCKPNCLARLSRIFNGYRYCGECSGNCGLPVLGCRLCGGAGCESCGGGGYGGQEIHDSGAPRRILDENWDPPPAPKPIPGKPIHKADTPHSIKVGSGRMPGGPDAARRASYEPWR